jgi:gliding motility-associated-like protein
LWEFGDRGISDAINPVHVYTKPGKYTVKLTTYGFGGTATITKDTIIYVEPFGSALFTPNPLPGTEVVIPEESVAFRPLYPCATCTYEWDFGDKTRSSIMYPEHLYKDTGWFDVALTVTSANGCVNTDTLRQAVHTVDKKLIQAPTAFIPDPNGPNGGYVADPRFISTKVFYPFTQGVQTIKMQIFNRWGQLMYQSTELYRGWDGYLNGFIAPADTYVYKIEVKFSSGEKRSIFGDVTLIH